MTSTSMKAYGTALIVVGVIFRLVSGTLLDWYARYVSSDSENQYSAATNLFSAIDSVVIPLGVGLLVGGIVVAAVRDPKE